METIKGIIGISGAVLFVIGSVGYSSMGEHEAIRWMCTAIALLVISKK